MSGLYSVSQLRQLEHMFVNQGISENELMERAAAAALSILQGHWPRARRVDVVAGKGNNGGDGLVLARLAHEAGLSAQVYLLRPQESLQGLAAEVCQQAIDAGVSVQDWSESVELKADVLVDALFGIGLKGEVSGADLAAIEALNSADIPVLSLDVPSGLDADSGAICGAAVHAQVTISFIAPKMGLYTGKAVTCCGEMILDTLDLAQDSLRSMSPAVDFLDDQVVVNYLPQRKRCANKGDFGHVLVVGGDYGMGGAVRLAAEAAMRVGSGLVTVATRPEHVNIVSGSRPELMCHQVQRAADLQRLLNRVTVIVLGPGLGKSEWARELFDCLIAAEQPKVMDADALNLLSETPSQRDDWILTPHPGEASRLLDKGCAQIQNDRYAAVQELQDRYGGAVILKGAGTIICSPDKELRLCSAGNPGMASGGMGDILSGMIGGLVAQGLSLSEAASVGVYAHAQAADEAVTNGGGERGLLATDLLAQIRSMVNPR